MHRKVNFKLQTLIQMQIIMIIFPILGKKQMAILKKKYEN